MRKPSEFERGFALATATVARRGEDTIAMDLLYELGVTDIRGLRALKLDKFDRDPLYRVIRQAGSHGA